ncbi:MAG: hypothetical protein SPJ13_05380 [Bacteroidales bacterium]|nr:hypothetical protein [Bacteroidales bacterium]
MGAEKKCDKLFAEIDALAFFRNTEYFMPFSEGYSAITTRFTPRLCLRVNDRTTLAGGCVLDLTAGDSSRLHAFPWLSFEYHLSSNTELTIGNIHGGQEHHLEAPLYDPERYFFNPLYHPEAGIQFRSNTHHWRGDTWLDWENFLHPQDYAQERFLLATRQEFFLLPEKSHWQVETPLTACFAHRGGQFSALDTNCGSLMNLHAGLRAVRHLGEGFLALYLPFYYYRDISGPDKRHNSSEPYHTPFQNGWGTHPQAEARFGLGKHNKGRVNLGYWIAHRYLSSRGSYLFQSASQDYETLTAYRRMITADAAFEHTYKGVTLGLDFQLFYDRTFLKADHAFDIYLRWSLRQPEV